MGGSGSMSSTPNKSYKTITKFKPNGRWVIRVWRDELELKMGPDEEVIEALSKARHSGSGGGYHATDFVDAVTDMPGVRTVEVLTPNGDGLVYEIS